MLPTKILTRAVCMVAVITATATISSTRADQILDVDLSVPGQLTIRATTGKSAITISASDTTGFTLYGFVFIAPLLNPAPGNLTSFLDTPDGGIGPYDADGDFNIYGVNTGNDQNYQEGVQAFKGEVTWYNITDTQRSTWLTGPTSGNVLFPYDDAEDFPNASVLGTWGLVGTSNSVPDTSSTLALLALGICCLASVRYKHKAEANA